MKLTPTSRDAKILAITSPVTGIPLPDIFLNTGGINAAATLFIAFIRIPVLKLVIGKREIDYSTTSIDKLTFSKKYTFILVLTIIHHFIVFGLEYFKWGRFDLLKAYSNQNHLKTFARISWPE